MPEFILDRQWGQHKTYKIDTSIHTFLEYFVELYNTSQLGQIHLQSNDDLTHVTDVETDLHKQFYQKMKSNISFKTLYCNLIKDIYSNLFPDEKVYIYQSFPSIRIQYHNSKVIPPHYDSDSLGNHPIGEKNFILPITKMYGTNRVFIESEPGKKDFQGVDLEYGELFFFNGNMCTHYNEPNIENDIRISLDFRIILLDDYKKYMKNNIVYTNPRDNRIPVKMIVGGYYQCCHKEDLDNIVTEWYSTAGTIVQTRPNFDINEATACFEYLKNGDNFITEFKKTTELERMICDLTGSPYCIMTTSGTSALMLAFLALDIGQGDEVIVPNYTMVASINSIRMVGATPIIVDIDAETGTVSREMIELLVTPKTKAVLHVSLNNRTKCLDEIVEFCKERNIYLVEDAAQSLGCFLGGKHLGTYGKIGCFSLSTPKIISTGQGGFLLTEDANIYKKLNTIKNFGRANGGSEVYEMFGLNLKYTDIQAVIGIEQMKKLPERIVRMREIYDLYYNELHTICHMIPPPNAEWIPWFIDIFIEDRDSLGEFLQKHNIQTRITYPQLHKLPMYSILYDNAKFVSSEYFSTKGLFLPSHTLLTNADIKYICSIIRLYYTTNYSLGHLYTRNIFITPTNIGSYFYIKNENTGLGNMLFQIASGLSYAMHYKANVNVIGIYEYLAREDIPIEKHILRKFHIQPNAEIYETIKDSYIRCNNNELNIFEHPFNDNIHFQYYYENYNNFDMIKDVILDCFLPNTEDISDIMAKYPMLKDDDICSLHIRLGQDCRKLLPQDRVTHYEEMYSKCIDHIILHKNIRKFFIFTNDKEYCQQFLSKYSNLTFYYSYERDYIDIWMISLMKNNICSHSTLSWWGSYLNINPDKYIVCWYGDKNILHYPGWTIL